MTDYPLYKAPSLAPEQAQLQNALGIRGGTWRFPFGFGEAALTLLPQPPAFEPACRLMLMLNEGGWIAELSATELLLLHPAFLPASEGESPFVDEGSLPREVRKAVMLDLLSPVFNALRSALGTQVAATDVGFVPENGPAVPFAVGFKAEFPASAHVEAHTALIRLSPLAASSVQSVLPLLKAFPPCRDGALAKAVKSVPLEVAFESGYVFLPLPEVSALQAEDVLIPEVWTAPESLTLRIWRGSAPALTAACSCSDGQAVLTAAPAEEMENAMNSQNDIDIRLSFELDRRTITAGELEALSPGYTFALTSDAQSPVTIRANGKAVARGRLVDMNGTLGVQITETL